MVSLYYDRKNSNGVFLKTVVLLHSCVRIASLSSPFPSPFGGTARNVATQVLQGAGPASVDLNRYNLPSLDLIEQEWSAEEVTVPNNAKRAGFYLACKTDREIFVDTVVVRFPRLGGAGLGIQLAELAGGRDDGIGITIVTGLVEGGSADKAGVGILPGDSISSISIRRTKKQSTATNDTILQEDQQTFTVRTECLSYDATVESIGTLPTSLEDFEDLYVVKVKRLRRKPKVRVRLQYPPGQDQRDDVVDMFAGENLRLGMLVRGISLNDPLAKRFDTKTGGNCGAGGLCRTCAVSVRSGGNLLNEQRVAEKQMLVDQPTWRLACKAIVGAGMQEGEMTIRVNPRQW